MGMAEVQDMISLLFSRSLPKHVLAMKVPKRSLGNMNEHWPQKTGRQLVSCSMFYKKKHASGWNMFQNIFHFSRMLMLTSASKNHSKIIYGSTWIRNLLMRQNNFLYEKKSDN
jgi:hypothetical protein